MSSVSNIRPPRFQRFLFSAIPMPDYYQLEHCWCEKWWNAHYSLFRNLRCKEIILSSLCLLPCLRVFLNSSCCGAFLVACNCVQLSINRRLFDEKFCLLSSGVKLHLSAFNMKKVQGRNIGRKWFQELKVGCTDLGLYIFKMSVISSLIKCLHYSHTRQQAFEVEKRVVERGLWSTHFAIYS